MDGRIRPIAALRPIPLVMSDEENLDPLTGAPGSHPASTGAGAITGGVAGGLAGAAIAGPVGAAIGIGVGAVAGGLGGKALARAIDAEEEAYWRENHGKQPYADASYEEYEHAYRTGYQGHAKHGSSRAFADAESDLEADYGAHSAGLPWQKARPAARAAWERLSNSERIR